METVSQSEPSNRASRIPRTTAWGNGESGMTTYLKGGDYLWTFASHLCLCSFHCVRSVYMIMANTDWGEYSDVFNYITDQVYPEGLRKDGKRALRQKAASFGVECGVLVHKNGQESRRVVLDPDERTRIIASLHADPVGGCHYGQTATIRKVTDRFWWRSVSADTREFVRSCPLCQKANPVNRPAPATLHPVAVGGVFHRWGIDLVGPLTETTNGNKYVAVATEYLTRWPEAQALPDKSAESVHRFLLSLVCRFGACRVVIHDQGREFNNRLVKDLFEQMKIDVAMTSAYHPQTNG